MDLNCGCPIYDATRRGVGAALLRRPAALARLVSELAERSALPLTVKVLSFTCLTGTKVQILTQKRYAASIAAHRRGRRGRRERARGAQFTTQFSCFPSFPSKTVQILIPEARAPRATRTCSRYSVYLLLLVIKYLTLGTKRSSFSCAAPRAKSTCSRYSVYYFRILVQSTSTDNI